MTIALAGLHDHDEYSLLDGAGTAIQHAEAARDAGYIALANTNHATLAGSLHHMRACREAGLMPISGCEMYWRPNRKVQGQKEWLKQYSHITLLADGDIGWRNLMRLVSQSHRDGFYGRACCDPELMELYADGIICLTGCLGGNLAQRIVAEDDRGAEASLRELIRIYKGRVVIEIMPHAICLSSDTMVAVADGRGAVSIEQLAREGKPVDVYASDNGRTVIRQMNNVRLTRRSARVVRVHLDDETSVRCTPDHKFLLADGKTYRRADELAEGESLMRFDSEVRLDVNNKPRRHIWSGIVKYQRSSHVRSGKNVRTNTATKNGGWELQYRMIGHRKHDYVQGSHLHHENEDTLDDRPENLEVLTGSQHQLCHWAKRSDEERVAWGTRASHKGNARMTPEEKSARTKKGWEGTTSSERSDRAKRLAEKRRQNGTDSGYKLKGRVFKPKMCACGDQYVPTSSVQKRCLACKSTHNHKVVRVVDDGLDDVFCADVDGTNNFSVVTGEISYDGDLSGVVVHNCEQRIVNVEKIRLANKYGLAYVTTVDAHYPRQEWAGTQDVLLMIATNQSLAKREAKREAGEDVYKFDVQTLYHLTAAEIMELYIRHHPDLPYDVVRRSIDDTLTVAAMCRPFLVDKTEKMPVVSFPGEPDNEALLRRLAFEGLERRGYKDDPAYVERVEFELKTFSDLNAVEQMLMAWDVVDWAKSDRPIPKRNKKTGELVFEGKKKPIMVGPGRGSAAGCGVSWATRITNVNPIKHRLLFERFLNPARRGKPDIDLDFPPERVDEVEAYVKVVHGEDRVVDIVAHSTFGPRAALSDAGRVLNVPYAHVKAATKTIDDQASGKLEDIRLLNPAVDQLASQYPEMWSHACRIQGSVARKSEHAGGLLILPGPAEEFMPVERKGGQKGKLLSAFGERSGKGNAIISDYGFNKLDVLRVAELTKQQMAVDLYEERTGERIVLDDLPVHDDPYACEPEVMQGFRDGLLIGIFQFCLAGDTILNGEPRKTIKDCFVNPPEKMLSVDLGLGVRRRNRVERIWEAGEKMLYRVNTSSNYTLRATADHKILTREGWKRVCDLTPDDEIAVNEADASRIGCCSSCGKQTKSRRGQCYSCSNEGRGFASWSPERRSEAMKIWHANPVNRETWKERNRKMADSGVLKGKNNPAYGKPRSFLIGQSRHRQHLRDDIPHRVRSSWEADYARYLMHEGIEYLYEPYAFELSNGRTYRPDFYLVEADKYVEIKGWWRPGEREKIDCFESDYPDLELVIIDSHAWAEFQLEHRDLVPNWECPKLPQRFSFDRVVSVDEDQVEMTYDVSMADPMNNFIANGIVVHNSATASKLTRQVKPDNIFDLAAINALIRPGPRGAGLDQQYARRKNGEEPVAYWHPSLEPHLDFSYGVMAFQESLIEVVHHLGGLSRAQADIFRKIASKLYRDPEYARAVMGEWEIPIKRGMTERGLTADESNHVWSNLLSFSDYSFNLAHASGYSLLAYRDMWEKIHIPREFYAALMSKGLSKVTKKRIAQKAEAVREARHRGLRIMPPDINVSGRDYTVVDGGIRLGLEAIKHIGPAASAAIEKNRPFASFEDMEARVQPRHLNVTARAALVMSGACDRWQKRDRFTEERIDELERELLGMSLTSTHSIAAFADVVEGRFWTEDEFDAAEEGQRVTVVGEVVAVKDHVDKNGHVMCFVDLAYGPNRWSLTVFASLYEDYRELLHSRRPILATGSKSTHKGRSGIRVETLPFNDPSDFVPPIMGLEEFVDMVGGAADDAEVDAQDSVFPEDMGLETNEPVLI